MISYFKRLLIVVVGVWFRMGREGCGRGLAVSRAIVAQVVVMAGEI